jgi:RNA polymerase sigma-70 factor (ECF subfamily)
MTANEEIRTFFSRGIEANMDALYGVALRLAGSGADAEDLVAEAVTKAWSAISTLEDRSRFRPWIFRILRNCHISQYRKQSVRPAESGYEDDGDDALAALLNEQPDEFLVWWANPEREFFQRYAWRNYYDCDPGPARCLSHDDNADKCRGTDL